MSGGSITTSTAWAVKVADSSGPRVYYRTMPKPGAVRTRKDEDYSTGVRGFHNLRGLELQREGLANTLESTQGHFHDFLSQLPCEYYQNRTASVGN